MAFGKKTKTADVSPAAKPTRARRSKPTPPPPPAPEPAPVLALDDLPAGWVARTAERPSEATELPAPATRPRRVIRDHDEEW